LKSELEEVKNQEEEAYENMPESFQYGEKGERIQEIVDSLDDAISNLESVIEQITEAQQ